jgi:hypothetical protein
MCTASDAQAVTVVIDFGQLGPEPLVGCATNLPTGATGADALASLGVTITEATRSAQFICRLNGHPAADQVLALPGDDNYVEACLSTPPASAYWTYWWADASGAWSYATKGYALHEVIIGGYEGYSFSYGRSVADSQPTLPPT